MPLTVEELQIKLGCDATQAQTILKQMDATVKAYTEKFQKYFANPKTGKVKPLDGVAKAIDKEAKAIESSVKKAQKIMDFTPKYKGTGLTYKGVANDIAAKARAGREAAKAYDKEFAKARPNSAPNARLLSLGTETANGIKAAYNAAKPLGIVTSVLREKIFRAYTAMRDLGKEYQKVANEQGTESAAGQKAEQAYLKAIYAVDKYIQQLGKAIAKEEELAQKRAAPDPKQVRAGNLNAENNPQWGNQGEGRMLAPSLGDVVKATFASLPDLVNGFVMKATNALAKVGSAIGKAFTVGSKIAVGALQIIGTVAQFVAGAIQRVFQGVATVIKTAFRTAVNVVKKVGGAIKKAFNHTLLGKFINRLRTVALRMAAMKLIRGTIDGVKNGLEELAKRSTSSAKAMNTIKAAGGSIKMALGAAVMPIVKALAPLFVNLAGAISTACNALARFFAVVTGQSTYTAVNFSDSLDGISESAGGAGKAAKKMLADFDELHVLEKNSGGGGGGSSGVESSLSTVADLTAVSELGTRIKEAIDSGDWTDVGTAVNEKLGEVSKKISDWAKDLKNSDIGSNLAEFFNGLFGDESSFYDLGSSVGAVLDGVITQISDFVNNTNWEDVGKCIKAFFKGMSDALENNEFILKIKIKFNEFVQFMQEKKVALLEWANDLPDWLKFNHDFSDALEEARKQLEETTAEGERLRKKLEELKNGKTTVTITPVIPEDEKVETSDMFTHGSWRTGDGSLPVHVRPEAPAQSEKVNESELFTNGAPTFSGGGAGASFRVWMKPEPPTSSQKIGLAALIDKPGGLTSTDKVSSWVLSVTGQVASTINGIDLFTPNSGVTYGSSHAASGGRPMLRAGILPTIAPEDKVGQADVFSKKGGTSVSAEGLNMMALLKAKIPQAVDAVSVFSNTAGITQTTNGLGTSLNVTAKTSGTGDAIKNIDSLKTKIDATKGSKKVLFYTDGVVSSGNWVDNLKKKVDATKGSKKVKFYTDGIVSSGKWVDGLKEKVDKTKGSKKVLFYTDGVVKSKNYVDGLKQQVDATKGSKKISFYTSGLVDSTNNVSKLKEKVDATKGKTLNFYTSGIVNSETNIDALKKHINDVPASRTSTFSTSGISDASKELVTYKGDLGAIPTTISTTVSASVSQSSINSMRDAISKALNISVEVTYKDKQTKQNVTVGALQMATKDTQIPHEANGGIAYGWSNVIVGEYAGAKNNPEVIAPLNKLQGILERSGSTGNGNTMTRDQANTMIQLLQRIEKKENVIQPSVGLGQVVQRSLDAYGRV